MLCRVRRSYARVLSACQLTGTQIKLTCGSILICSWAVGVGALLSQPVFPWLFRKLIPGALLLLDAGSRAEEDACARCLPVDEGEAENPGRSRVVCQAACRPYPCRTGAARS